MKLRFTLLCLLTSFLVSTTLQAQTAGDYRSVVATTGLWSATGSWQRFDGAIWQNNPAPPTSTDNVITIQAGDSIRLDQSISIDQVVVEAGAFLTVTNAAATVTLANGAGDDLVVDGRLYVYGNGILSGTGTVVANTGALVNIRTLGRLAAPTTIAAGAELYLTTGTPTIATTVTNNGTIVWGATNFNLNNGTIINNGNFYATTDNSVLSSGGTNLITNNGTFIKGSTTGNTTFAVPFTNTGTFEIQSGTVVNSLAAAVFTNTGTITFNNTGLTNNSGTVNFNVGTVINGTGTYTSGTGSSVANINTAVTLTNVTIAAGTIGGTGSLNIPGTLSWAAGAINVATTLPTGAVANITSTTNKAIGSTFTNDGTINWSDGNIAFNNATLTNNGTINEQFSGNWAFNNTAGTNAIVNTGTITKTSTNTLTNNLFVPMTNSGTLQGTGTFVFTGGLTNDPGALYSPGTPGNTAILTTTNAVVADNSTLFFEIGLTNTPGTGFDRLAISTGGVTTLDGTLSVVQNPSHISSPLGIYTIMTTTGSFAGAFDAVNLPSNYIYLGIQGAGSDEIQIQKIAAFPLPVKWGSFFAEPKGNAVNLSWTTLEELNASHFVVEHSLNGKDYNSVGTVTAKGNTSTTTSYQFKHQQPSATQKNFYRIRQVDVDGKATISDVRHVSLNGAADLLHLYPNPVRNALTMLVQEADLSVNLMNVSGSIVKSLNLKQGSNTIDISELPTGMYFVAVIKDGRQAGVQKITKL